MITNESHIEDIKVKIFLIRIFTQKIANLMKY